ncbi:MAG: helix-turn-helix domain-containing protein [Nanoarchaeota archaeon]
MWSLKFTVRNNDSIYALLTRKYEVTDYFYPLDFYRTDNKVKILGAHVLEGTAAACAAFSRALKKHVKTKQFDQDGNLIVLLMEEEEAFYELIYNPALYHPSPTVLRDGVESWHVASYDRKALERLMTTLSTTRGLSDFRLLSLTKTSLRDIYFPRIIPELPAQQKRAFQIAITNRYYSVPRKTDLRDLAAIMGVSLSTYQEHLRKAEGRLLPFFAQDMR